ncbi:MDR efflux pump AcrAB transcriptional activator RobA [Citrobacter freundii]|uniref:MDR efflux pump AcrAB transcriptional activator RobA n=1 Tax=Citrobacter TaxID=544 RepID=UPI000C80F52C|nr:MDR efflux pump AcrAB transcriptional activator RobA [Citrobacter freundii]EMB4337294.1 MDR efflux pump AcrAB transcriptional activator RobA [Citrobacter freundii]MBJ9041940.1 MDR efflux pump AcrAB transcriptional activator RobA [Citrobacter freundii]NTY76560.1 MDR efflux pump AcrAB transcriptional activator RobA [Citrobacter freundii]NUA13008.1 MDR efflux pump AcrAB transcriptional activator RobA [Citrobacter freundii]PMD03435.1 MDR efflux pump AcrAB transcriptional activator RobA [Citroba
MDQVNIIRDLLIWLEGQLDQPLSLDSVATKSGYSKWHLQRMFKNVTGQSMGSYIRARRLTKTAIALRLTSRSILDIGLQYCFDSQQSFTRAFKNKFAQPPASYRRADCWNTVGIHSPLRLEGFIPFQPKFVTLPETKLVGIMQTYSCRLEQISSFRTEARLHFWQQYLGESLLMPPELYGLNHSRPSKYKDDEHEMRYITALEPRYVQDNMFPGASVILPGGDYARFLYKGPTDGLQDFIISLYEYSLPTYKMTRRKGFDVERFRPPERVGKEALPPEAICCEYFIPVLR